MREPIALVLSTFCFLGLCSRRPEAEGAHHHDAEVGGLHRPDVRRRNERRRSLEAR